MLPDSSVKTTAKLELAINRINYKEYASEQSLNTAEIDMAVSKTV